MHLILVLFASVLAGFTQTVSGFGCGIVLMLFVPGVIGVFIGHWLGMKVVDRIPQKQFKQMIYLFLIVSGVLTLL